MVRASDIMTTDVVTIDHDATIYDALSLMRKNSISCVIITEDGQPIGIMTERDIVHRAVPKNLNVRKHKVHEIMTSPLVYGEPGFDISRLSLIMRDRRIRRLPIIENKRIVGVITQTDIVDRTRDIAEQNHRIMFQQNIQTILIIICVMLTAYIIYHLLK